MFCVKNSQKWRCCSVGWFSWLVSWVGFWLFLFYFLRLKNPSNICVAGMSYDWNRQGKQKCKIVIITLKLCKSQCSHVTLGNTLLQAPAVPLTPKRVNIRLCADALPVLTPGSKHTKNSITNHISLVWCSDIAQLSISPRSNLYPKTSSPFHNL